MSARFKPKILVIEKDAGTLRLFDTTLKAMGATPRCVTSGQQASEVINKEKFDGVFLDWETAELGGEELTHRIRRSKSNSTVPIAMITGRRDTRAIAEAFKVGVTFYLQKPVGAKELTRLLNASRGAMLAERRRYERAPVNMSVILEWEQKQVKGQCVNLGSSGMLLTVIPRPAVNAEVGVEFTLPNKGRTYNLKGTVVRYGPGGQVGVKFGRLSAEETEHLIEFVERALAGSVGGA